MEQEVPSAVESWAESLAATPTAALERLCRALDGRPAVEPRLEELYWQAWIDHGDPETVAWAVLERLRLDAADRLLEIAEPHRGRLQAHFERLAWDELRRPEVSAVERERAAVGVLLLAAAAFEDNGKLAAAAALNALAHDEAAAEVSDRKRCEQAWLRFKLAQTLLLAEETPQNRARLIRFAQETLRHNAGLSLSPEVPSGVFNTLCSKLHYWIARRWEEQGEPWPAAFHYEKAALYAEEAGERVVFTAMAAECTAKLGDLQGAYRILMRVEHLLPEIDGESRLLWEGSYGTLRTELGGEPGGRDVRIRSEIFRAFQCLHRQLLAESPLDPGQLRLWESFLEEESADLSPEDHFWRHKALVAMSYPSAGRGDHEGALALLKQAEALEEQVTDERQKLLRQHLQARVLTASGRRAEARALFESFWPRVEAGADPALVREVAGNYLEALSDEPRLQALQVEPLAGCIREAFRTTLAQQPSAAARRKTRDQAQRALEAALLSLAQAAQRAGSSSSEGQRFLSCAWAVLLACRNPELASQAREAAPRRSPDLWPMEDEFHSKLRIELLKGQHGLRENWLGPLDQVFDEELPGLIEPKSFEAEDLSPPEEGIAIAFFPLRDLSSVEGMLVLGHHQGRFELSILTGEEGKPLRLLTEWNRQIVASESEPPEPLTPGAAADAARGSRPGEDWDSGFSSPPCSLCELLPQALRLLAFRRLAPIPAIGSPAPALRPEPLVSDPWFFFPDGPLTSLPIEVLPDHAGAALRFGQRRAIQHCLRSRVPTEVRRPIPLERGWLGLGGAPEFSPFAPYLPSARKEICDIARQLRRAGLPAVCLLDREAHAAGLEEMLREQRPAGLHLAVHGTWDEQYPDACALVLARSPGRPEGELLPYRRIAELPLAGVELVVLSACGSLRGRSSRSTGMEGMAWAFLQAGATQVIASRYQVDDVATARFMARLYHHLQGMPVAEALGITRDEQPEDSRQNLKEIAAWSVWC